MAAELDVTAQTYYFGLVAGPERPFTPGKRRKVTSWGIGNDWRVVIEAKKGEVEFTGQEREPHLFGKWETSTYKEIVTNQAVHDAGGYTMRTPCGRKTVVLRAYPRR